MTDLSYLPRSDASTIEMLAEAAGIHFSQKRGQVQALLEQARHDGRYRDALCGELSDLRKHLRTALEYQAAARKRRMAKLTDEERDALEAARFTPNAEKEAA